MEPRVTRIEWIQMDAAIVRVTRRLMEQWALLSAYENGRAIKDKDGVIRLKRVGDPGYIGGRQNGRR